MNTAQIERLIQILTWIKEGKKLQTRGDGWGPQKWDDVLGPDQLPLATIDDQKWEWRVKPEPEVCWRNKMADDTWASFRTEELAKQSAVHFSCKRVAVKFVEEIT